MSETEPLARLAGARRRRSPSLPRFFLIAAIAGIYLVVLFIIGMTPWDVGRTTEVVLLGVAAAVFGFAVAWAEIVAIFRDEPIKALAIPHALVYSVANGFVSFATFAFLLHYNDSILPVLDGDLVLISITAGFGAMTVLRSKLLTFRSEDGKEYAVGPAIVVDAILQMLATEIDRQRALERQEAVRESMDGLAFDGPAVNHMIESLVTALASLQALNDQERAEAAARLRAYAKIENVQLRMTAVGFAALTMFGEQNFKKAMETLRQQAIPPPPAP